MAASEIHPSDGNRAGEALKHVLQHRTSLYQRSHCSQIPASANAMVGGPPQIMASALAGHFPGLQFPAWMDHIDEHSQPSSSGMVLATAATVAGRLDGSHETLNTLLPTSEGSWGESLTATVGSVFSGHNSGIWKTYPLRKRIAAYSRANTYDGRHVAKVKSPQDLVTDTNRELQGSGSVSVLNPSTSSMSEKMKWCPLDKQEDKGLVQSALLGAENKDVVAAPKIGRPSLRRGRRRPSQTCRGIPRDIVSCEEPRKRRLASLTAQTLVNLLMEKEEEEEDDVLEKCAPRDKEWSMDVEGNSCSIIMESVTQGCSSQRSPCRAMAAGPDDCSLKQSSRLSVQEIASNDTKWPLDLNCSIESPLSVVQCVPDIKNDHTSAQPSGCLLKSQANMYQVENAKNNVLCTAVMDFTAQDAPLDLSMKSREPIGISSPEDYRDREKCFPSGYSIAADISAHSSNLPKVPNLSGTLPVGVGIANEEQVGIALSSCSTFQGSFLYSRSTLPSYSQTHPVGGSMPTSSELPVTFDTCHLAPGVPVWATTSPPSLQFNRGSSICTTRNPPVEESKCTPAFLNYSDSWLPEMMYKYYFGPQKVASTDTDLGMLIGGCGVSTCTTSVSTPSVSPPQAHSAPLVRFPTSVALEHAVQPIHSKDLARTDFQPSPAASFSPPCQSMAKDFQLEEITQRFRIHGETVQEHGCFVPISAAMTEGVQPSFNGENERVSVVQKQRAELPGRGMPGGLSNRGSISLRSSKSVVDSNARGISTRHPPLPKLVIKVLSREACIVDTVVEKSVAQLAEPASTWRRRQGGDGLRGRRGPGRPPRHRHITAVGLSPGGRQFPVAKRSGTNGWLPVGEPFYNAVYIAGESEPAVRRCYPAVQRDGLSVQPRDCVLLRSGLRRRSLPYIAKISALWENPRTGELTMSLFWYYRPEHTQGGRPAYQQSEKNEVFASRHQDENSVACIEEKCYVLTLAEYCRFWAGLKRCQNSADVSSARSLVPNAPTYLTPIHRRVPPLTDPELIFLCRAVYDFRHHRLLKNPPRSSPSPTPLCPLGPGVCRGGEL
uniref:uncharacterized protein isoform X1 n=2 Tax=Myxine glutinosa TaxID=7769 RepID=UPI00358E895E